MIRVLIGRIFGLDVAAVKFGFGYETRFVRYDADGTAYCWCYGHLMTEDKEGWRWLVRYGK